MATHAWFLADGSRRLGPYTSEQIPGLVQTGTLRHETLVWNEDLDGWQAARGVPEMMLYLRGVPETGSAPAPVATDVLSRLIDQVTSEVSAEVMGNMGAYTKEAAVTKSGRHVAIDGQEGKEPERKRPASAPAPAAAAPKPAPPAAPAPAPVPRAPEPVVRPAAAAVPVPTPAPVSAASPATPSSPATVPDAVPAARPASPTYPFGSMPPDPFAGRTRAGAGRKGGGPVEVPADFLRLLGMIVKGVGCVAILAGIICVLYAVDTVGGRPMQRIALFGMFLMPLVVGLSLFGFGFFLDLWLAQQERMRPLLEAARKNGGGGA